MSSPDEYRIKAAELSAAARKETNLAIQMELENIARGYLRLAEQADKNAKTDMVYETPSSPSQLHVQQQQQPQADQDKKD